MIHMLREVTNDGNKRRATATCGDVTHLPKDAILGDTHTIHRHRVTCRDCRATPGVATLCNPDTGYHTPTCEW